MEDVFLAFLRPTLFVLIVGAGIFVLGWYGIWQTVVFIGGRLHAFLHSLSQMINHVFLMGEADQCIEGRCYAEDRKIPMKIINTIFFWQDDHCQAAYYADVSDAARVMATHKAVIKRSKTED